MRGISASLKQVLSGELHKDIRLSILKNGRFFSKEKPFVNKLIKVLEEKNELSAENIYRVIKEIPFLIKYIQVMNYIDRNLK